MRSSEFKRSPTRVNAAYKKAGTTLVAMEPLRIYLPERFIERDLALIEDVSYILGFFAVVTEDNYYASSTVTAMLRTEPDRIGRQVIDDVGYVELSYSKGSKLIASTEPTVVDNLIHRIWTEFYGMAKIPWYYQYEDLPKFFRRTNKYNGATIGANRAVLEFAAATLCRDPDDPTRYYRQRKTKGSGQKPPYYVSLKNVAEGATSVLPRLGGSYFDEGMTVSLSRPSERAERVETMLRT